MKTHLEALEEALFLALTAPTTAKAAQVTRMADYFAESCSPAHIAAAKRRAKARAARGS